MPITTPGPIAVPTVTHYCLHGERQCEDLWLNNVDSSVGECTVASCGAYSNGGGDFHIETEPEDTIVTPSWCGLLPAAPQPTTESTEPE